MEEAHQRYRSPSVDFEEKADLGDFGNSSQDEASLGPDLVRARQAAPDHYIEPAALFYNAGRSSPAAGLPDHSTFFAEPSSPQSPTSDDIDSTPFLPMSLPSTSPVPSNRRFFARKRNASTSPSESRSPSPSPSPSSPALVPNVTEPTNLSDTEYKPTTSHPQNHRPKRSTRNPRFDSLRSSRRPASQASEINTPNLSDLEHLAHPPRRGQPKYLKLPPPNLTREELEVWHQAKIERLEKHHQEYMDQHTRGEVMALSEKDRKEHDKERDARMSRLRRARKNYQRFKEGQE